MTSTAPSKLAAIQLPTKTIIQPAGARMFTTNTLELLLNKLPKAAREAHEAPTLTNNLLSVSVLCDAGCDVWFHMHGCEIAFNGETIIRGWRDLKSNMWRINLIPDGGNTIIPDDDTSDITSDVKIPDFFANSIYECENLSQLITFYHATMGYPVVSTWCKAISAGYFQGWPSLTSKRVRKFIKTTSETEMGHMDQRKVGIRSTKTKPTDPDSMEPVPQTPLNDKTHHVYMSIAEVEGRLYSDQTGRFPITSNRGNCYVVIFYAVDGNYVKSYPIKSRHRSNLLKAYDDVYSYLRVRGYRPQLHKLDNETSKDAEEFIAEQQAKVQYTPADMHRTNLAERAIRTWKNHFTATRAGTPSSFKMANWCKMTEQCDITLNMMRPCTTNPRLSAFEAMEGTYSFDATPMAPMGTPMLMHLKPVRRGTWDYHAVKAWYYAPALKHYRVIKGVLESGATRLTDTWKFKHHALPIPSISQTDRIVKATQHLATVIEGANPSPPDELTAIENLRALISKSYVPSLTSSPAILPTQEPTINPAEAPTEMLPINEALTTEHPSSGTNYPTDSSVLSEVPATTQYTQLPVPATTQHTQQSPQSIFEPALHHPTPSQTNEAYPHNSSAPAFISQDDDEPIKPRYNLRSRANVNDSSSNPAERAYLINSQIDPNIIPATNVLRNAHKYSRGLTAANHALQIYQLALSMHERERLPNESFANAILDEETGRSLEFRELIKLDKYRTVWMHAFANELGRLAQGIRDIVGTDTIDFIPFSDVPKFEKVTYGRIVCTYRPQKDEHNRCRLTVGGNLLVALYDVSTPTADLVTAKLLFNSVISTPGARFLTFDLKNFYLKTPLPTPRYMRMHIDILPDEIIDKYNLRAIVNNGWVYFRIKRGMYGLPEAGILANKLLKSRLIKAGYYECQFTPGLYKHVWRPIMFSLVVDDFGVKCQGMQHARHLKKALEKHYEVSVDWEGKLFCGVTLDWNYDMRHVDLSVPGYVDRKLIKYGHKKPKHPQHSPYLAAPIVYGAKVQSPVPSDKTALLSDKQIKHIQDIVGSFIWYSRACDPTLAAALSALGSRQSNATTSVQKAAHHLLDYLATHPSAAIRYHASDMVLAFDTDASYLSEVGGKSRAAAYYYMTRKGNRAFHNGAIDILSTIIKHVMSSASEAETGALYYGCKRAIPFRNTLEEMGHPQHEPTPATTDNNTAHGLTVGTMDSKASKSNDMRFQWLKCRKAQRLFRFLWAKGSLNRADHPSKHHQADHHIKMRPNLVVDQVLPQ